MATGFATVQVQLDSLQPHPRNYRTHPDDQLAHIVRSIELHGVYRNVVIARDGTILAGHGVVQAARRLGLTDIPVIRLDVDPDDTRALQVLTGDNEIANLAEDGDRELVELLRELSAIDVDNLIGTGFDEQQLNAFDFVSSLPSQIAPGDETGSEWLGLPGFESVTEPRITIRFLDLADRDRFVAEVLGADHYINRRMSDDRVWMTWWPPKRNDDVSSVRFEDADA